jgi:hypothetical protein
MTFLIDLVSDLIEDRPGSDVDDLARELPEYTRKQILAALRNSAYLGRLRCERQGTRGGYKGGAKPGRYYLNDHVAAPAPRSIPKCANSVWALGDYA